MPAEDNDFFCEIAARYIAQIASPGLPKYVLIDFDDSSLSKISQNVSRICNCHVRTVTIKTYRDTSQLASAVILRGSADPIIVGVQRSVLGFVASITSVLRIFENSLPSVISGSLVGRRERNSSDLADLIFWMSDQGKTETMDGLQNYVNNAANLAGAYEILLGMFERRLLLQYPALLPKFHPIRVVEFMRELCSGKSLTNSILRLAMIPSSRLGPEYGRNVAKWYEDQLRIFAKLGNIRVTSKSAVYRRFLEKLVRSILWERNKTHFSKYVAHLRADKKVPRYGVKLDNYEQSGPIGTAVGLADTFHLQIRPRQTSGKKLIFGEIDEFSIDTMKLLQTSDSDLRLVLEGSSNQLVARIQSVEGYLIGI